MKAEGTLRRQLKQVLFRHFQKELRAALRRGPITCIHNHVVDLWPGASVGVCAVCPAGDHPFCDPRMVDLHHKIAGCPWIPKRDKETIRQAFRALITSGDVGRIATRYPDAAALMWVLDSGDLLQEVSDLETEAEQGTTNE